MSLTIRTLPGRTNRAVNPSFDGTQGWAVQRLSFEVDPIIAWVGQTSGKLTVTDTGGRALLHTPSPGSLGAIESVTPGDVVSLRCHIWTPYVGLSASLGVTWWSTTTGYIGGAPDQVRDTFGNQWTTLERIGLVVPAGADWARAEVYFGKAIPFFSQEWLINDLGDAYWIDSFDIAINEPLDSYVDGEQGTIYHWLGTPHESASVRDAVPAQLPTGRGGQIWFDARVYAANKLNQLGAELTSHLLGGSVDVNIERVIKSEGKLTLIADRVDTVRANDWLALFVDSEAEDGSRDSAQVGLFRLEQPKITRGLGVEIEVAGLDVTSLLADAAFADTYNLAPGSNEATNIRAIIESVGLLRHAVPDTGRVIPPEGVSFPPGMTLLEAINARLTACACYTLWGSRDGVPSSAPYRGIDEVEPARTYQLGDDVRLVGDLTTNPNDDAFGNLIIVTKTDPTGGVALRGVAVHDDPLSPSSTVNREVKAKVIAFNEAADQAALDARAALELEQRSIFVSGTLEVVPDPSLEPHSTIELVAPAGSAEWADVVGRWWVPEYSSGLMPNNATVSLRIRRTEHYA